MKYLSTVCIALAIILGSMNACQTHKKGSQTKSNLDNKQTQKQDDQKIEFTILQINDVYEIAPLNNGKIGGIARVAALKNKLIKENPNTLAVIAGDFLNPSLFGSIKYQDKKVRGKQMIEALNTAGIDLATFGNHEFDIKEEELIERLNESTFDWVSSNVKHRTNGKIQAFTQTKNNQTKTIPETYTKTIKDKDGTQINVGFWSVTLPSNPQNFVWYGDCDSAAIAAHQTLKKQCDVVLALTHQELDSDLGLANKILDLTFLMGGHEHNNMLEKKGKLTVVKADANAKTAYIHRITYDKNKKTTNIRSELVTLDQTIPEDPATAAVVQRWMQIAHQNLEQSGFNPSEIVANVPTNAPWEGREAIIRHQPANLPKMIAQSMSAACPTANAAILNSGSVRVDDQLSGNITQYDVLRTLPFGGSVWEVEMKGILLEKILQIGKDNKGSGGFLQYHQINFEPTQKKWQINGKNIDNNQSYKIAISDFLMSGKEAGLPFLTETNSDIISIQKPKNEDKNDLKNDIRKTFIDFLKKNNK